MPKILITVIFIVNLMQLWCLAQDYDYYDSTVKQMEKTRNTTKFSKLGDIFNMIERLHQLSEDLQNSAKSKRYVPLDINSKTGKIEVKFDNFCRWGNWTAWTQCSVTCGSGREARWRQQYGEVDEATIEEHGQFQIEVRGCHLDDCNPWGDIIKSIGIH